MPMDSDAPHHTYFRSKEGHWRGRIRFAITDPHQLQKSPLRVLDKWALWSMAQASRRMSTLVLATTVDYTSQGHQNVVAHTTRTSNLGVTLFRSQEVIRLADDGYSFQMTGSQAFFPQLWRATAWTGHGAVATDHDGAVYHLPLFSGSSVIIEQHTRMTPQGLGIVQTTPFSRASILLRWQPALTAAPTAAPHQTRT